jgi:hypothetical protein
MFSKALLTAVVAAVFAAQQVRGHCVIVQPLGVKGTPVRNDVQRPSTANPCGTVNIANTLDTTTASTIDANGQLTTTATNFNT